LSGTAPVRISNGLARFTIGASNDATAANRGRIGAEWWSPGASAWTTIKWFALVPGVGALNDLDRCEVMHNRPGFVAIRLAAAPMALGMAPGALTIDVALRRGERMARCLWTTTSPLGIGSALVRRDASVSEVASAAVNPGGGASGPAGVEATSFDAQSCKYQVWTARTYTVAGTQGGITLNDAGKQTWDFAIGARFSTDTGGVLGAAGSQLQYLAAQSEGPARFASR
jgi:hypothetical protein